MLNQIISIVVLMLFVVVWFIGCGFIGTEEVDMQVEKVGLLSVSENRPATVLIGVLGSHHNTGADADAKVSADRDGNTIHISATKRVFGGAQGDAVSDVYGEVTVRNLEVGEYKIMNGGHELLKFRIAADAGYVKSGPIVAYLELTVKTADGIELFPHITPSFYQTSEPVQVTMGVVGYFDSKCVPYLKTHIERRSWTTESGTPSYEIYVDISGEVPIVNTECALKIHPTDYDYGVNPSYYAEIDLGTFPLGWHHIKVNDANPNVSRSITIGPDRYR